MPKISTTPSDDPSLTSGRLTLAPKIYTYKENTINKTPSERWKTMNFPLTRYQQYNLNLFNIQDILIASKNVTSQPPPLQTKLVLLSNSLPGEF